MVVRDPGRIKRQRRFFRLDLQEPLEATATLTIASCANPQSGLSMDSAEKLYGTASSGGGTCAASLFGCCTVLVFDAVGRGCLSSTIVSRFLEGEVLNALLGRAPREQAYRGAERPSRDGRPFYHVRVVWKEMSFVRVPLNRLPDECQFGGLETAFWK